MYRICKQKLLVLLTMVFGLFFLMFSLGEATVTPEYVSLYGYRHFYSYCSTVACNVSGNCEKDAYPCKLGAYPYKYTDVSTGFRDIHNLNDPRILCGIDYEQVAGCSKETTGIMFAISSVQRTNVSPALSAFPESFRVFIPPGTVRATVYTIMPSDTKDGLIVRFKRVPKAVYSEYAGNLSHFKDIPWEDYTPDSLKEMADHDMYLRNREGFAYLLDYSPTVPLPTEEAGWLYIKKLPFESTIIRDVKVVLQVDVDTYLKWYNSLKDYVAGDVHCVDSNEALTPGKYYCWDGMGDPWTKNSSQSVISPICDSSHLSLCKDDPSCTQAGGYYYDNKCNAVEEPACGSQNLDRCKDDP